MERRTYTSRTHDSGEHPAEHLEEHATTPAAAYPAVHEDRDDVVSERVSTSYWDSPASRVNAVLFVALLALESLLALRFTLLAFGANLANDFVDFIMDISRPFVRPFEGAFADRTWDEGIIEVNTLLAMGVYLLAYVLVALLVGALLPKGHAGSGVVRRRRHVTHV